MDTARIEALIAEHCAGDHCEDELRELLAAVAESADLRPNPRDLDRGAKFVKGYIEQVPYMIAVAATAATNVGLEEEMNAILEMVESYWLQEEDVIPDHLGVIGLLDDAYCSLTSLQAVSDHYRLQTGKHLFPEDLSAANRAMRKIIGDPYITDLDRMVTQSLHDAGVMAAVKALASPEKKMALAANATIWNHGPAGDTSVDELSGLGLTDD